MKKILFMLSCTALLFQGCYFTVIDSGETGVERTGGTVSETPLSSGINWSMVPFRYVDIYNTKAKKLEMSGQNGADTSELMNDGFVNVTIGQGLQIPIDVAMLYTLKPSCAPLIRKEFGEDVVWDNKVVIDNAREAVRKAVGRDKNSDIYKLNQNREMYGNEIQADLQRAINETIGKDCVSVTMVTIKDIHIPQSYADSIMKKNQMEEEAQRTELQVKKAEAEAKIEIARAEGTAKAQLALAKSITPDMLKWRDQDNTQAAIAKWNGVLPTTSLGQSATPFIGIK